ncbi:hypothetical protein FB562_1624 [Homoserinimonas aerilata]|uniref:DUF6968 domain-containing protein n=1 Tax=Homoserinimonas aerilata TaxID=1162970 RepID=A0A542YKA4_9MICO|nr:hypothetical protein [Homoserinimonas aerilata]TQL48529.1 hypothetical protein FB562_1624 [Homoserinimonas aerilata]
MTQDLGTIIARRTLERDGEELTVLIGLPVPFEEGLPDHFCPVRLEDSEGRELWATRAGGIDSVQALVLALSVIGDRLAADGPGLTFLERAELGFPLTDLSDPAVWSAHISYPLV